MDIFLTRGAFSPTNHTTSVFPRASAPPIKTPLSSSRSTFVLEYFPTFCKTVCSCPKLEMKRCIQLLALRSTWNAPSNLFLRACGYSSCLRLTFSVVPVLPWLERRTATYLFTISTLTLYLKRVIFGNIQSFRLLCSTTITILLPRKWVGVCVTGDNHAWPKETIL